MAILKNYQENDEMHVDVLIDGWCDEIRMIKCTGTLARFVATASCSEANGFFLGCSLFRRRHILPELVTFTEQT